MVLNLNLLNSKNLANCFSERPFIQLQKIIYGSPQIAMSGLEINWMKYLSYKFLAFIAALFLLINTGNAQEERILKYDVLMEVMKDRSIKVKEEITVNVTGAIIKRGITRGLPRTRRMFTGEQKPVRYNITKVLRDGKKESYQTRQENGMEVMYIGKREVILRPGEYHYTIEYLVPNQVEQLEEIDEIYWNAIGKDSRFPIDEASCLVRLPPGANHLQKSCYTGPYGSDTKKCTTKEFNKGNEIFFQTTESLQPREAFTIGVGFEKGIVEGPSFIERYGSALLLSLASFGLLGYFVTTWNKYGVDPPKPTPYPLFASPQGYSPSSLSYIAKESYQTNKVTASIINLAVQGYLRIDETVSSGFLSKSKVYTITRLKTDTSELFQEDRVLMQELFSQGDKVTIDGNYEKPVKRAYEAHQNNILAQHEAFINEGNNRQYLVAPIIISFLTIIGAVFMMNRNGTELDGLGLTLLSVVFIGLPALVLFVIFSSKGSIPSKIKSFIIPFLFFVIFTGGTPLFMGLSEIKGTLFSLFNGASINAVALGLFIPTAVISLIVYAYLIKRPTEEKLQLQSEIEGFKMYLEMAEKDRMNLLNPPDRTPEHFEAMLPFAFALGVEHKWAAIFKSILEAAAYQPNWSNNRHIYTTHHFSSDFSRSIVNSATPPPPANSGGGGFGGGSGGGGFSGGGGGGGSVGGW